MKRSAERLFRESPAFRKIVGTVKGIKSGEFDLQCVIETAEDARAREDVGDDERRAIADDLGKFRTEFARIIESEEFCPKESVLRAVRLALLIGASAGLDSDKLADLKMRIRHTSQAEHGTTGGKNSGRTRRNKAIDNWETDSLKLAQAFVKSQDGASQDAIAEHIRFKLDDLAPGHRQVKRRVSEWQKTGKLTVRK